MSLSSASRTPSLTPSRSSTPEPPVQPDHFYGSANIQLPPSPHSDGRVWLSPEDDPLAHRGIPVFRPTMEEFKDFEQYMTKIECWGMRSGVVKVIPPREWTEALPSLKPQLKDVKIRTPIEQHMLGTGGLFRQENMEKRKVMSVREWFELCGREEFRTPGVDDVGLHARSATVKPKVKKIKKKVDTGKTELADTEAEIKDEPDDEDHMKDVEHSAHHHEQSCAATPSDSGMFASPATPNSEAGVGSADPEVVMEDKVKPKPKRSGQTREAREASLADRAAKDVAFLETFNPHEDWLPPNTKASDYTPEFCQKLERQYWRNCGLGKSAWYGADTQGSLYTDETTSWNVAHLPSTLSRLLPPDDGLPGVNTPYLYFGMWRATFAWHVEDMDLFSINYVHFGAPKFWYAVPQGRASALEQTMRGYFPKDTSRCPQFLRHKSFLASPTLLAQSSCRPNHLVQHAGEFVITFPRGYHAGFNLGLNCAESVNFALDSWIELGKRAKACECISDSVRIDVEQLLRDRAFELDELQQRHRDVDGVSKSKKRKSVGQPESAKSKKPKTKSELKASQPKISLTLKIGPRPLEIEDFPCCLCISTDGQGLLPVHDPPVGRKDIEELAGKPKTWMAHESCANVIPETWVDEIEEGPDGVKQKYVFGVDAIVKDRWNLKCSACTKSRQKAHGAPVQCTKGKCPKAFHVNCAREGLDAGIVFTILREIEKEVVLVDAAIEACQKDPSAMQVDASLAGQLNTTTIPNGFEILQGSTIDLEPGVSQTSNSRVLKIIKKQEVEILCTQHNPIVTATKKANKQDKIKSDLLALPSMARIKIRVSAGVFEVSLIRVIEETKSVEVLWDRGIKREFKWGSVVFGNTGANVQQKPSEMLTDPGPNAPPAGQNPTGGMVAKHQYPAGAPYYYPSSAGHYGYWPYQGTGRTYATGSQPYPYGYYATAGSINHSPYMYSTVLGNVPSAASQSGMQQAPPPTAESISNIGASPSQNATTTTTPTQQVLAASTPLQATEGAATQPSSQSGDEQAILKELVALSSMQPSQIADALRDNPQLRDIVWAAVDQAKKTSVPPLADD
ncbi:hypothetical protein APHAL10511_003118 [Amanita phalloides]|nr:hypothetical protein APHAL10511_003118 [Amanita phalloides]